MNRRELLKASAMAAAAAAAARLAGRELDAAPIADGITWDKAPCRFCGTGCHVQVGVKDRKIVAIAGDQKADVNKGLLCVKGYHVALAIYGKDRLTTPLLRQNGKLVPISWDKALDVIADRILANPAGFAFYGSGQWTIPEGYAAQKLVKAGLATNQIDPNARLCMASAVTGYLSTYGVDEPAGCYEDLDRCTALVIWGNNPAEMHPVLFSRVLDRRTHGDKITIVDLTTRRTRTSAFSDRTILFTPQGDLAIANGIAHLLLERGTWDRAFVERYCNFRKRTDPPTLDGQPSTFDEYRAALAAYTPAHVEKLSGVSPKDLSYLADLFGDPRQRITSVWCMGPNQHTRGTAINDLLHGIHLLSGHFGKPGDAPTSLTGQPSACGTVREVGTLAHALPGGLVVANAEHRKEAEAHWNLPPGRINPKPGYHTVEMWRRFSTPTDQGGDIDTIWVQVTNPARSLPNINELFEPSRKLPGKFLIVSDVYPTATVQAADLVLPSAMWVEKNGMVGNSERRTQQWFRMVPPPGEARDDCWQTIAVAKRLHDRGHPGLKDKSGKFLFEIVRAGKPVPIWEWAHYYDVNVDEHLFEEYRKFTRHKHKDLAPYQEYVAARGLRWPVVKQRDGSWRETKFRFSRADDPYATKADVQFYHSVTKDDRALIWFHPWEAPPEVPDATYPFWLCTGRVLEHWHTGTMTMRIPQLHRAMPQAYVELHRDDARRLGVADGEVVVVESRRGRAEVPVWIDGRGQPPPGTVFVPFFDENIPINRVTLDAHDPLSKQPDYKKCAVRIRKRAAP
jgi:nitrate reductase NapA